MLNFSCINIVFIAEIPPMKWLSYVDVNICSKIRNLMIGISFALAAHRTFTSQVCQFLVSIHLTINNVL